VIGDELAIEQLEAAHLEARDKISQRDLGSIAFAAEHTLPEKGTTKPHAIQAADQLPVAPGFDRMGMAASMQIGIGRLDRRVDPSVGTI
jgi:hypothetical protein